MDLTRDMASDPNPLILRHSEFGKTIGNINNILNADVANKHFEEGNSVHLDQTPSEIGFHCLPKPYCPTLFIRLMAIPIFQL